MNGYRLTLELRSALGTPLAADTLWGHIAWGIRYSHGEAALTEWLDRYDTASPPLIISDPFPAGYWPRPILPGIALSDTPPTPLQADRMKSLEKHSWISHAAWKGISTSVSPEFVLDAVDGSQPFAGASINVVRAGINRLTGGTLQTEGGALFSSQQTYFRDQPLFDVWVQSPESALQVREWFEFGLSGGYGRDASSGLGHLVLKQIDVEEIPCPPNSNAVIILAPAVPKRTDPCRGFFKMGLRHGRLGGDFSIGELPGGSMVRQKRPVQCLLPGTVLLTNDVVRSIGRVLSGVHPEVESIRHYGMAPALPCQLASDVLDHPLLHAGTC